MSETKTIMFETEDGLVVMSIDVDSETGVETNESTQSRVTTRRIERNQLAGLIGECLPMRRS